MADLRIGITGCAGRMGQTLIREVAGTAGCRLAAGSERPGHPAVGRDLGTLAGLAAIGVAVAADAEAVFASVDAVLDYTAPEASVAHAALAAKTGTALVIGTTGLTPAHLDAIRAAAARAVIVQSANTSVCVNVLLGIAKKVAAILDPSYDIEIVEMHHRHKVDAPSGTALALGRAVAAGRNVELDRAAVRGRDGITGARAAGTIGFASLRGGDVVGDHTVVFAAEGERLELTHKASSRHVFSKGAVRAALWSRGQKPGRLYSMADVLGLAD